MNNALPTSGVARLYEVLAHVRSFPTPIRPVAIMAGISEDDLRELIAPSLYAVIDEQIQHVNAMKHLECVSIGDMDHMYRTNGVAAYVKDGRIAWLHVDGYEDSPPHALDWQVWQLSFALSQAASTAKEEYVHEGIQQENQ